MSRQSISMKLKSNAKGKARGKTKRKELSWQPSINAYFGGKSLPTQPTLRHFIQKQQQASLVSDMDLKNSLDGIDLRDKVSSNENSKPMTSASVQEETGLNDDSRGNRDRGLSVRNSDGGSGTCGLRDLDPGVHLDRESLHEKHDVITRHYDDCRDNADSEVMCANILQEIYSTNLSSENGISGSQKSPLRDKVKIPPGKVEVPLKEIEPSLTVIKPPQGEILRDSAASNEDHSKRRIVNPFVKLQSEAGGSDPLFISTTANASGKKGVNEQGLTSSTSRKGLSLKARKRKFVMSPSKPRQRKPVKQVFRKHRDEENMTVKSGRLSNSLSCTPPLFTTPSTSHCPTHTPSLFTPCDRDLLQQYSTHNTPCRRLCLADLESEHSKRSSGNSGDLSTGDVISRSHDPTSNVTAKSCDHADSVVEPQSDGNVSTLNIIPSDFTKSDVIVMTHDIFDQSHGINKSHDPSSESHDIINESHDLFNMSHDSFDEVIKQSCDTDIDRHDNAARSHDPYDDITATSHDLRHDFTARSHAQGDNITVMSRDRNDDITARSHGLTRHLVLERAVQELTVEGSVRRRPEVLLRLLDRTSMRERLVFLRDEWVHIPVSPGDTVQVNPPPEWNEDQWGSPCVIDGSNDGSVIVSPDLLISPTAIATSITCPRRSILSELFKGVSKDSVAMVTGNLLHQVFQGVIVKWAESCKRKGHTREGVGVAKNDIDKTVKNVLSNGEALNQLYSLGISDEEAHSILSSLSPSILEWCSRFLHSSPVPGKGDVEFKRSACDNDGRVCVSVDQVHDIEENIWSPRLGLKGKVDVTLQIKERRSGQGEESSYRVPMEIKTGKMYRKQGSLEHRAQLSLYALMLRDRYHDDNVPGGLLYYMKAGHMQGLPAEPHEIRGLLMARNMVAGHYGSLADHMTLPGMLKDSHVCKHCPYQAQCCLVHKSLEQGTAETSGLRELFTVHMEHLSPDHIHFFREREGVAMGNMVACQPEQKAEHTNRHSQKFIRRCHHTSTPAHPHTHTLSLNERTIVSRQDGAAWAIAMGTVAMTNEGEVELLLDKPVSCDGTEYRLDVAPSYHGNTSLTNLAQLCSADSERDAQLRHLLIDLCPPRYYNSTTPLTDVSCAGLNSSQKSALEKVLRSKDYTLILGRPGTGKTTTISRLVQTLVQRGSSVLVTSYTHSAVDNILLKLRDAGVDFLRLGSRHVIHPSLHQYTPSHTPVHTVAGLERLYQDKPVVATTCLGVKHALFSRRSFDYCIVDEASQLTLPVSLGPLRCASVFVLVGDHYQLPPLVQNQEARDRGLAVSLFRLLSEHHPNSMATLHEQYRMNSDIMLLSNTLFYNHQLRCGSVGVASSRLLLPLPAGLLAHLPAWLQKAVDPDQPVIFLDTDQLDGGRENASSGDNRVWNITEVEVVSKLVCTLLQCGVSSSQVGVVTPYRYQQLQIREALRQLLLPSSPLYGTETASQLAARPAGGEVEVNTVDRYQGRDKECVIVSFVRSNPHKNVGNLLCDWRRVNVALTRAKHKLILVGSRSTLPTSPSLHSLLELVTDRQWITHIKLD